MEKNEIRRKEILNGNIFSTIFVMALPLMFGNLVQTLYGLADTYWVSNLISSEAFGAISFVWPIQFIFMSFGIGFNIAATSLMGQAIGKSDYKLARALLDQFAIIAMSLGFVFLIIGYNAAPFVLKAMGAEDYIYTEGLKYLRIMFFDSLLFYIFIIYKSKEEAQGNTLTPTIITTISVAVNIILDPIFIMYVDSSVAGVGYATIVSRLLIMPFFLKRLFGKKDRLYIDLKELKIDKSLMWKLTKIAMPSAVGQALSSFGFTIMNSFILSYGTNTLVAFQLGNRITNIFMMPAMGISGALASFIGQNIGAKQFNRAKRAVWIVIAFSGGMMCLGSLITFVFKYSLIGVFIKDSIEITKLSADYMNILAFIFPTMAIFFACTGAFSGSGHTMYNFVITSARLWILRLPMIIIAKNYTDLGSTGIWYSMLLSNVIICIVGLIIVAQGKWVKSTLENNKETV